MGNAFGPTCEETRSLFILLRAYYQQKVCIKHQISCLSMNNNYHRSNPTPKQEQETHEIDKIILNKISALKALVKELKTREKQRKQKKPEFLKEILNLPKQEMCHLLQRENPEDLIIKERADLANLKRILRKNQEKIEEFKDWHRKNLQRIDDNMKSFALLSRLKAESNDIKHYLRFCSVHMKMLKSKKKIRVDRHSISRSQGLKKANSASANALILKSKRSLHEELDQKVENLKKYLDFKLKKTQEAKQKFDDLHNLEDSSAREILKAQQDKIKFYEVKLDFWVKEREKIQKKPSVDFNSRRVTSNDYNALRNRPRSESGMIPGYGGITREKLRMLQNESSLKQKINELIER